MDVSTGLLYNIASWGGTKVLSGWVAKGAVTVTWRLGGWHYFYCFVFSSSPRAACKQNRYLVSGLADRQERRAFTSHHHAFGELA